jgi:LmbE family N-acetylglucosaminyl deacetylase
MSSIRSTTISRRSPLRLLGVYAHPDDETFCAGGTLAKYAAAGAEIMVVSATQGEAGQIRAPQAATRHTLGQTRAQELQHACQILGVQHAVCLDYGDGKLQGLPPHLLTAKVTEVIRSFRPDIVLTFGQDGAYGHPDHMAIGAATDAAFQCAGDPTRYPEQLVTGLAPHRPARLYHSVFPRRRRLLTERLVQWLVTHIPRFCGTSDFVRSFMVLAEESTLLGYSGDHIGVCWYPPGFAMVEQGEPASSLYLILSGQADVIREAPDGRRCHVAVIGPGAFFGEEGLAYNQPRNAHVIAREGVTCLVLSPEKPTAFAGRGQSVGDRPLPWHTQTEETLPATCIDVSAYVPQKIAAITAHHTQCPMMPELLPGAILQEVFADEHFVCMVPGPVAETDFGGASAAQD